ncbi:3'(2'),5'-bisphosphate nucleotidase [Toxoplasma gondii TgCatPRC2]|uniref:3'(2'),5'-bisphosphate nucleotidase 1 n=3 Tax=Toxoplasma gondii TaxID=5811 RepID=A0A151HQX4_TOXGO|nr:3'(2'),5'-bisphosphate nucleotidase [Toxoplasma gondii ME49]EPT26879.1 3'(2'),5'-bisphosphate nucleotidase [Toxoplasma gondii ME49]KFG45798.1 3'(2'),5'-bisphosphate nucleotidase [Toxoplasma gondii GAB2-2007-GAL-DOM2]KYK71680.1 3'(2'),5'-bisphosphate nucleotidase [Toxoplasma gondii TgCatPRC2]|eukprot:XP_018635905.1 3'(2'),5'-bisphosphate nucleotidase [Toxoplasma gondii ME49]
MACCAYPSISDQLDLRPLHPVVLEDINVTIDIIDIVKLACQASQAVLEVYNTSREDWEIEFKHGKEPLTRADLEANQVICTGLTRLYGSAIPIVSEENTKASWSERSQYTYFWLIDPLDGTKEFIKRNGQFTVNIGLCRRDEAILGVVTVPTQGQAFLGAAGIGSYKLVPGKPREKLQSCPFLIGDPDLKVTASSSHNSPETVAFIEKLTRPQVVQCGSSLKILMLAEGRAHLYPRFALCSEWDTCAAHAVLKFAGGEIYQARQDADGLHVSTEPLRYHKEDFLNPFFVAVGSREASKSLWSRFSREASYNPSGSDASNNRFSVSPALKHSSVGTVTEPKSTFS